MAAPNVSRRDFTAFDYRSLILPDQQDVLSGVQTIRKDGGDVIPFFAGTPLPAWGDIAGITATADDSVHQKTTAVTGRALGPVVGWICKGRGVFGPNCFAPEFGTLAVGSRIFVQVNGVAYLTTDGTSTVTIGDLLIASTTTAGKVVTNNSPSTGQLIAKALQSATATPTVIRAILVTA